MGKKKLFDVSRTGGRAGHVRIVRVVMQAESKDDKEKGRENELGAGGRRTSLPILLQIFLQVYSSVVGRASWAPRCRRRALQPWGGDRASA